MGARCDVVPGPADRGSGDGHGCSGGDAYGEHVASQIAGDLSRGERVVAAGGAYGIEGAAHRAALASGGDTIAVLTNGVDRPYPAGHRELLDRIADVGLLVSEVPPGSVPTRQRFLAPEHRPLRAGPRIP